MPYHVASGALRIGTDRGVRRFDFACGECLKGAAMLRAASRDHEPLIGGPTALTTGSHP